MNRVKYGFKSAVSIAFATACLVAGGCGTNVEHDKAQAAPAPTKAATKKEKAKITLTVDERGKIQAKANRKAGEILEKLGKSDKAAIPGDTGITIDIQDGEGNPVPNMKAELTYDQDTRKLGVVARGAGPNADMQPIFISIETGGQVRPKPVNESLAGNGVIEPGFEDISGGGSGGPGGDHGE